jgi:hypothetical protein
MCRFCLTNCLPGSDVSPRRASKLEAHEAGSCPVASWAMSIAEAVPFVMPQPAKPVAVKTRREPGLTRPTKGIRSSLCVSSADQW